MKRGWLVLLLLACAIVPMSCEARPKSAQEGGPIVRVLLGGDSPTLTVQVKGPYELRSPARCPDLVNPSGGGPSEPNGGDVLARGDELQPTTVSALAGRIKIGGSEFLLSEVDLFAKKEGTIGVADGAAQKGKQLYRGWVRLKATREGKVRAINYVRMEDYLAGVLAGEMPPRWPVEALKAQAIAARTYALYQIKIRGNSAADFDLYSDTRSQVYLGVSSETERTSEAVKETAGVVATYRPSPKDKPRLFPTYYHSTCGGATEDVRYGFGERLIPPLSGQRCNFCEDSPLWRWSGLRISKKDLQRSLAASGSAALARIGEIDAVKVEERTPTARARTVRVRDSRGAEFLIDARYFRTLINRTAKKDTQVPSTGFEIIDRPGEIELKGFGFGHGVGLCQYGARFLAERGKTAVQILRFYYPEVWLARAY